MLVKNPPFSPNNIVEKITIYYKNNGTDEYYIDPQTFEPSIDTKEFLKNEVSQIVDISSVSKLKKTIITNGSETNTLIFEL